MRDATMFTVILGLLLVFLLVRWDTAAFHQPQNARLEARCALLRWLLLVGLLWLTVTVFRRDFFCFFLPHPGMTKQLVGPLLCATDWIETCSRSPIR